MVFKSLYYYDKVRTIMIYSARWRNLWSLVIQYEMSIFTCIAFSVSTSRITYSLRVLARLPQQPQQRVGCRWSPSFFLDFWSTGDPSGPCDKPGISFRDNTCSTNSTIFSSAPTASRCRVACRYRRPGPCQQLLLSWLSLRSYIQTYMASGKELNSFRKRDSFTSAAYI